MVDRSVLARRPAAPNNPFSSPLKDGILGPSLGCASEKKGLKAKVPLGIQHRDDSLKSVKRFNVTKTKCFVVFSHYQSFHWQFNRKLLREKKKKSTI